MITVSSFSEIGDHAVNEDVFDVRRHPADPDCWLCFLADGQGGHQGGERAARLACQVAAEAAQRLPLTELAKPETWIDVLQEADAAVAAKLEAGFTTLIGFCIACEKVIGASSGDSAVVAAYAGAQPHMLTDRQAKNPPVGSGAGKLCARQVTGTDRVPAARHLPGGQVAQAPATINVMPELR